jgi:hypothetical protein
MPILNISDKSFSSRASANNSAVRARMSCALRLSYSKRTSPAKLHGIRQHIIHVSQKSKKVKANGSYVYLSMMRSFTFLVWHSSGTLWRCNADM